MIFIMTPPEEQFIFRPLLIAEIHNHLAGECIGELVRFFSFRMSCIFPPLPSHSTLRSSIFRFWWAEAASSLKVKAGKGKAVNINVFETERAINKHNSNSIERQIVKTMISTVNVHSKTISRHPAPKEKNHFVTSLKLA